MIPTLPNGNPDNDYWHTYRHVISGNGELHIQRIHDYAWIPESEQNGDYRRYLKWIAAGNTPEEIDYRDPIQAKAAYDRECEECKLNHEQRTEKHKAIAMAALIAKQVKS